MRRKNRDGEMSLFYRNLIMGIMFIYIGFSGLRYFTGYPKFNDKEEEKRKERVEKWGVFLLICSLGVTFSGIYLLYLASLFL